MNTCSVFPFSSAALVRLLLVVACVFTLLRPAEGAERRGGKWDPNERAREAVAFFTRVQQEFLDRARRLEEEGAKAPEVELPFIDSASSREKKDIKDWDEFSTGKMGESGTTRWIAKGLKELEAMRKKLAAAEKTARPVWDKKYPDGRKPVTLPAEKEAFIYDISVQAKNLGVILDNSPSMRPSLPAVRAEIGARFAGARYVEVDGCQIEPHSKHWGPSPLWFYTTTVHEERNPFDPRWFLPAIPQEDIHYQMIEWRRNALAALEAMIVNLEVDAIYWFCDFDDEIQLGVVQKLGELIEEHRVRLYVHTVKSNPPASLVNIIRRSGGKMTKADPATGKPAAGGGTVPADTAPMKPATRPAASIRHNKIPLNEPEVIANEGRLVEFDAVVKEVSTFSPQKHVRLDLEDIELYAACKADRIAKVFKDQDPLKEVQPGDKVTLRGRITVFKGGHFLLMEDEEDFFVTQRIREVPGTTPPAKDMPAVK